VTDNRAKADVQSAQIPVAYCPLCDEVRGEEEMRGEVCKHCK